MDPKPSGPSMMLAPARSGGGAALRLPSTSTVRAEEPPRIDERLVEPETREQLVRGRRVVAMPANPEHGDPHFQLGYIIGAHLRSEFVGSTDLLTRTATDSDFATDTCVRRRGTDPATQTRYLEELAFEVVNTQSNRDITEQAEDLVARGVRRVVAIFVNKHEVCEWTHESKAWTKLDPDAVLDDPVLAQPVRVRDLLDAANADDAVARALLAKGNQVFLKTAQHARAEGRSEGLAEGERRALEEAIAAVSEVLGVEWTADRTALVHSLDVAGMRALLARLRVERRWPDP